MKEIIINQAKKIFDETKLILENYNGILHIPKNYTIDIYIDKKPKYRPKIIDFNPWVYQNSEKTNQIL